MTAFSWVYEYLGDGLLDIVREQAYSVRKIKPAEKEEIYQHYKRELKRMEQERLDGKTGRLELENPL